MNNIKKNSKISFILFVTLVSGILGSIYNSKLNESWFIKYQIETYPQVYVYGEVIDRNIESLELTFFKNSSILDFTRMKAYKNEIMQNERIVKADITPDIIALYINGPLDGIENELNNIIDSLNKFLQSELDIVINNLIIQANNELDNRIKNKIKEINLNSNLREIYEIDNSNIMQIKDELLALKKNYPDLNKKKYTEILNELENLFRLTAKKKLINSAKIKREKQNTTIENIEKIKNILIKEQIYKLANIKQIADLKPKMIVSIIAFSLSGFFISLFIVIIFGLFEHNNKTKILRFFGIYL